MDPRVIQHKPPEPMYSAKDVELRINGELITQAAPATQRALYGGSIQVVESGRTQTSEPNQVNPAFASLSPEQIAKFRAMGFDFSKPLPPQQNEPDYKAKLAAFEKAYEHPDVTFARERIRTGKTTLLRPRPVATSLYWMTPKWGVGMGCFKRASAFGEVRP